MMQGLQRSADAVLNEIVELVYYMKNVGYEEMMRRTPGERQHMRDVVQKHHEAQTKALKKSRRA